ncbi:MAG: primase C-terminal domain-containing protein [Candidatus Bathyarchaeota archaeon]|nr:primase C-terminal domain-containing protein [Candidatus Bathyarchaeota archaeon]
MKTDLFVEVCVGLRRKTPPEMVKETCLLKWREQHQSSNHGLFTSIYRYPVDDPYLGGVISDFYMDFDNEKTPDKARKEAIAVIKKLISDYNIPEAGIAVAFSGMKGISLTVNYNIFNAESLDYLPLIWKSIVQELVAKLKLKTVDTSIYERRRLWRLLNSRHQKTGLYKVPLTLTELEKLSIEEIKELATKPRELLIKADASVVPKAEKLFLEHKTKVEAWISDRKKAFEPSELTSVTNDPPCVKRLLEAGAKKGERNNFTFHLALYYASKGLNQETIEKLCIQFSEKCDEPLKEREVAIIVKSAMKGIINKRYRVGCSSEAFANLCDKTSCPFFNLEAQVWAKIGEPITFVEWKETVTSNFLHLWPYAEACASTIAVLLIQDTQPFALVLQGAPSGGKTTTLDFFRGFLYSHATDKFTPRAFVSHVAQKSEAELKKIDLLPRIKGRVLITPDLTTLFGAKAEELKETFSLLTRVLDGRGLTIDSGVYGARGYEGDYMFTWIGATTPIPHSVWDLFGNLGARMYFMQIIKKNKSNSSYVADLKQKNYRKKVEECNQATLRFLKGIWREERIEWCSADDPDNIIERVVQLAKVVTRLRGKINVVVKEEFGGEKTFYSEPIIEEPERCIQALYALMRGHALIQGRTRVDKQDLPVVIDVALSSAPWDRVNSFTYLLGREKVATKDLMTDLKCSRTKAIRAMKTLELLELVTIEEEAYPTSGGEQCGYVMRLNEEFAWFQSAEFRAMWRLKTEQAPKANRTSPETRIETLDSFKAKSHMKV